MDDIDDEPSENKGGDILSAHVPVPEAGGAAPVESPLSKLIKSASMILGSGKNNSAPSRNAGAARPGGAAVHGEPSSPSGKKMSGDGTSGAAAFSAPLEVVAGGPLMSVVIRNEFYRDGFRNMMRIVIAESIIIVVLILTFIVYMNAAASQDRYFATTADGRIMQLVPLDRPNMATSALMSWAAQSAVEVMTFGFHDYQRRMQNSSRNFTRHGWETFTSALQKSRIMESVEAGQQVVTAQPRSAPIIREESIRNGKYRWVVDLPLSVSYQSGAASRNDSLMLRMVIERVPSLENPNGVGIEQWIAMDNG
ncbi:MAG: type IVB secretion system apparatus protein IcmL/DotI [Pseudomonadota bacterium]